MRNLATWKLIGQNLEKEVPVMLLYVLESAGSSPGRQGFFMAISADGEMEGSIGGGIMEHKFVEMGKEKLLTHTPAPSMGNVRKQVHDKSAAKNQSGMICSGEQTIFLYQVQEKDLAAVKRIIETLEQNENGLLTLYPGGISFENIVPDTDFEFVFRSEADWQYREKAGYKNRLFIIGGGHCSLAFSNLMSNMDFYISVYDERKGLKTMLENKTAHEKHIVDSYTELKQLIHAGNNHYVVIMTFGYRSDDIALRAVIDKDYRYIGLLGSKTKIEKLFEEYRAGGINEARLQRIHTPIGLSIESHTPEEIAVSIAAQIIKIKNDN
jgi:xanthine dehydrogenase accessory factor